ncbi:MAG: hypothetical protein KDJ78_03685, partial [Rhodobacteraceae bacterium]|nr:hypothetical protein [Paracoccaceae bacterium]
SSGHLRGLERRGVAFGEAEFARVGELVLKVVNALAAKGAKGDAKVEAEVLAEVGKLTDAHPIYG